MTDIELIDRFLAGDDQAFEDLIVRYESKIYSTCFYFLANRDDALDAAQDSIVKVYRKLSTFRRQSSFATWLNHVTANTCRDLLRKKKRQKTLSLDQELEGEEGSMTRQIPSTNPGPLEQLEGKERARLLEEALFLLSQDHRIILLMRQYQHLSYEEIAKSLKISVGTVKSRIHRARRELRELIESSEHLAGYLRQEGEKGGDHGSK